VNELRRQALETPLQKRETLRPWPVRPAELPPPARRSAPARPALWARFQRWEQAPEEALAGVEELILPLAEAGRVPQPWRPRTILELPRAMVGGVEAGSIRRGEAARGGGAAGFGGKNVAHLPVAQ